MLFLHSVCRCWDLKITRFSSLNAENVIWRKFLIYIISPQPLCQTMSVIPVSLHCSCVINILYCKNSNYNVHSVIFFCSNVYMAPVTVSCFSSVRSQLAAAGFCLMPPPFRLRKKNEWVGVEAWYWQCTSILPNLYTVVTLTFFWWQHLTRICITAEYCGYFSSQ